MPRLMQLHHSIICAQTGFRHVDRHAHIPHIWLIACGDKHDSEPCIAAVVLAACLSVLTNVQSPGELLESIAGFCSCT